MQNLISISISANNEAREESRKMIGIKIYDLQISTANCIEIKFKEREASTLVRIYVSARLANFNSAVDCHNKLEERARSTKTDDLHVIIQTQVVGAYA